MRIAVLLSFDRYRGFAGAERIKEEIVQAGHEAVELVEEQLSFSQEGATVTARYQGAEIGELACIIARPNFVEEPTLHVFAYEFLRLAGYEVLNGGTAALFVKNKLMQRAKLVEEGIATPRFATAFSPESALAAAERIGYPVVAKLSFGAIGKGVFFARDRQTLSPIVDYLAIRDGNPMIIEEFIEEATEGDLRVFVVGGEVIASMWRKATEGELRNNAHLGGVTSVVQITAEERALALASTKALGLDIAGVDILRSKNGPLIMEVNANPGFEALEAVSGVNVAKAIVDYAISRSTTM